MRTGRILLSAAGPFLGLALWLLPGCQIRPVEDLVVADVALRAAQKVKADALAPDFFRKAENHFLRAKKDYNDGYYDSCRKHANEARMLAEQAEFKALLKQTQLKEKGSSGDDFSPPPTEEPTSPGN